MSQGYLVRHLADVEPTPCPCGQSTRIFTRADGQSECRHPALGLDAQHIMNAQQNEQTRLRDSEKAA